jgi:hypothetical protein
MKTWLTIRAHAWQVTTSLALVLAATLLAPGTTIASEPDDQSIDPATQAAWLYDHFCCEHAAEMPASVTIDPATQAAWLYDHFCCEHAAEMAEA